MPLPKKNRDNVVGTDEVATDYKLQQFLEDVQKFTEKSKRNNKNTNKSRKPINDNKESCQKRGLFENGFRSKPFLKENKARLKSNLNDLVKECSKTVESEEVNSSSDSQSTCEESNEIRNQDVDNNNSNNNNIVSSGIENAVDESERLHGSEATPKPSNSPKRIIKDRNQLKELLWEKYNERMKSADWLNNMFPGVDPLAVARQKINLIIYRTFLQHARRYPKILRRIFHNDEIKKMAQVVVKDTVDKCQQTEDLTVTNDISCEKSAKKDSVLSFPNSSKNSFDNHKEPENFFDLNITKKNDNQVNFLETLENQADIYSPGAPNTSPGGDVTPPPSPFPADIKKCWAPSTLSTPRKPEIFTPTIPQLQPTFCKPSISPLLSPMSQANLRRNKRKKKKLHLQFLQNINASPQLCFPKRKRMAYSPHRL